MKAEYVKPDYSTYLRQHKIKIIMYSGKNFWLLLVPLIRGLLAWRSDLYTWLSGAWLDMLVLLAMIGMGIARWYFTRFEIRPDGIACASGIIARASYVIPYSKITAVTEERPLWLRPFGAANLHIDTDTGIIGVPDLKLTVSKERADDLFNALPVENKTSVAFKPSRISVALFSVFFSSTISGAAFIATLLAQSGKLVGEELEDYFIETFNETAMKYAAGIPPLALGAAAVIIIGWLLSFLGNAMRHYDFAITRKGKGINIDTGMLSVRRYHLAVDRINYADLRQSLTAKLFRVISVHVSCSGYGKAKNEIPVLVPITTRREAYSTMRMLLPHYRFPKETIHPQLKIIFSYIWLPVVMIFGFLLIAAAAVIIVPGWSSLILFASVMAEIPSVWLLIVKMTAFYTTGIGFDEDTLALNYSFGYAFHTVYVHRERIAKVSVTRSVFQFVPRTCTVRIYTNLEHVKCHIVRNLPIDEVESLVYGRLLADRAS